MTAAVDLAVAWTERLDPLARGEAAIVPDESLPYRDLLPATLRDAAVLVPLRRGAAGDELVLTRRHRGLRHHGGEVSFPGGRVEPTDGGRLQAALREAHEEIGLAAELIRPLGCLAPVLTVSGFAMMPFVAEIAPTAELRACPREVDEVFTVPLPVVLDPANFERRRVRRAGRLREFHVLHHGEHVIWGATAAVILDLATRLGAAAPAAG